MPTGRIHTVIRYYLALVPLAVVVLALMSLAGWWLDHPYLATMLRTAPPMMPSTAVGLMLLALALSLLRHEHTSRKARIAARVAAALAVLIGLVTLLEYATTWHDLIDRWLMPPRTLALAQLHPDKASPRSGICLVLLGVALLQLASATQTRYKLFQILALIASYIPYVALIGYIYSVRSLYAVNSTSGMALDTTIAFLLLGLGVLVSRPDRGLMETVTGGGTGGRIVRNLLLPFIALRLLLGWFLLIGADIGAYDVRFAASALAASGTLIFGGLIAWTAYSLDVEERRRLAAEAEAARNRRLLEEVVTNAPVVLFATDREGCVVLVEGSVRNREHPLGPDALGKSIYEVFQQQPGVHAAFEQALKQGHGHRETFLLGDEAFEIWFRPVLDGAGVPKTMTGVIAVATDVTERQRAEAALKRQNAQMNAVLDTTTEGILLVDELRRVQRVNRRFREIWGVPSEALIGASDDALQRTITPHLCEPAALLETSERATAAPRAEHRNELELKDGRVIECYSGTPTAPDGTSYGRAWFYRDVTARKRLEQSLQTQNEQLKTLDRLKNDFVNAISHDLRTPLTSIRGFAEFLEDGIGGPLNAEQLHYVEELQKSTTRLDGLVGGLLDFARLQAGTFHLNLSESDLTALAFEIVASFKPQAEAAGVALTLTPGAESLPLTLDAARIQQVLSNLIANAVKFTPAGGTITVSVQREGDGAHVAVTDTGVGIAAEDLPRLFQRFSQLEAGKKKGGTGLGLWISRWIVEAHGGAIGVNSAPGKGSTFWFRLPLAPPQGGAAPST